MSTVHVVVPSGIDDPSRPSGGNRYDRRICHGLTAAGWSVREHPVRGAWPRPDPAGRAALARAAAGIPDGATVLVDGLIGSAAPEVLVPAAARLRLVVLVHLPLGDAPAPEGTEGAEGAEPVDGASGADPGRQREAVLARERAVLAAAAAVVTTSAWTRRRLLDRYRLEPGRVHVAPPGVDAADLAPGTPGGGELLCVAAVTPGKGHDVLLAALASLQDLPWRCAFVGSLDRDPGFARALADQARASGIGPRVRFTGPLAGGDLDRSYAGADVLVLASHAETYAMVVTEALARGLPVLATDVGGLPEALGRAPGADLPGRLVPPGDPALLAAALRDWLEDGGLRQRLRRAARARRAGLTGWSTTVSRIAQVLAVPQ